MPSLLIVCADLMLGSKAVAAAKEAEFEYVRTLSQKKAEEKLAERPFDAVLLDLELEPLAPGTLAGACGDAVPVAFVSHVKTDLIEAGRAAGWNVLTRGQMATSGSAVLSQIRRRIGESGVEGGPDSG